MQWYTKDSNTSLPHKHLRIEVPQKDGSVKVIEAIKAKPLPIYYAMLLPKRSVTLRRLLRAIEEGDREEAKAWGSLDFFYSYQVARNFDTAIDPYNTLELFLRNIESNSLAEEQVERWLANVAYNTIICLIGDLELNKIPDYLDEAWGDLVDDCEALNIIAAPAIFKRKDFDKLREFDINAEIDMMTTIENLDMLKEIVANLYELNG